jgi:methionyl-tRNA synthetase
MFFYKLGYLDDTQSVHFIKRSYRTHHTFVWQALLFATGPGPITVTITNFWRVLSDRSKEWTFFGSHASNPSAT